MALPQSQSWFVTVLLLLLLLREKVLECMSVCVCGRGRGHRDDSGSMRIRWRSVCHRNVSMRSICDDHEY